MLTLGMANWQTARSIEDYEKAFIEFSDATEDEILIRPSSGAIILYEDKTYRVCHYDDLISDFKTYFKNLSQIYTETPGCLWQEMLKRHVEISKEDLIIDIFNSWKLYWEMENPDGYQDAARYEELKGVSFKEFEVLVAHLQEGEADLIDNAEDLNGLILLPVIALTIKRQFKDEEAFFQECVDLMIEEFPDYFGADGNFDEVEVNSERYFVYEEIFDY